MFGFFKMKKAGVTAENAEKITPRQFAALLLNDERLMMPVYLPEICNESDGDNLGVGPLVYIWNVDYAARSFSLSVNGKCVSHLLKTFIAREDAEFEVIRDETMRIISDLSLRSVQTTIQETGVMPDVLFAYQPAGE